MLKLERLTKANRVVNKPFIFSLAFTLAEVLITLGIIGVVAEMTIPTLMNNVQSQVFKTGNREAISVLNQVLLQINSQDDGLYGKCNSDHICLRNAFLPYLKYSKTCDSPNNSNCVPSNYLVSGWENGASVVLNNGFTVVFYDYASNCSYTQSDQAVTSCGEAIIDVNGSKKPNTWGQDLLWVEFTQNNVIMNKADTSRILN